MAAKKKAVKKKRAAVKKVAKKAATRKRVTPQKAKKKVRKPKVTDGTCFVLIPFKEPFETYYRAIIRPAIGNANLDVKRGDSLFTPTPIMGDIWKMIQDAKVLVAELTEKNANVFYELGLAHAIGKPVVLITETMDDVPFDLRPLRVILYDKDDPAWGNKLKTSLTNALQDTMSAPVEAVPPMFRKKVKSQAPEDSELSLRLTALERQVRMQDTDRPLRSREPLAPVSWSQVKVHLSKYGHSKARSDMSFKSREQAIAWTVAEFRGGSSLRRVRKDLSSALSDGEMELVLKYALSYA